MGDLLVLTPLTGDLGARPVRWHRDLPSTCAHTAAETIRRFHLMADVAIENLYEALNGGC